MCHHSSIGMEGFHNFLDFRFELPLDMSTLAGMEPVDFLARHVTVTTSRRQLYDKVKLGNY